MNDETIRMYGALWCPDCIRSKDFLTEQRVPFEWIDIEADPTAASRVKEINDGKQIIPTIVFADGSILVEPSNDELARKLGLRLKAKKDSYDLIIVGGGPAGLTAAIYAARERIDCLVIEKSAPGGQPGRVERYDNYPGFPGGVSGVEIADRMVAQARENGVEILQAVAVGGIARDGERLRVTTEQGDEYSARAVLIATGTGRRKLGVPGEERLTGRGVHYCATCDGPLYRGADEVMVVGGGTRASRKPSRFPVSRSSCASSSSCRRSAPSRCCRRRCSTAPSFECTLRPRCCASRASASCRPSCAAIGRRARR